MAGKGWTQQAPLPHTASRTMQQTEMARRQILASDVTRVLVAPEHIEEVRPGPVVYQARVAWGTPPTTYLLRVFVDIDRQPPDIVTVYRTSKLTKDGKGTA